MAEVNYTVGRVRGKPFLGSLREIRDESLAFLERCFSEGDIVEFRIANKRVFGLHHPDLVSEVLVRDSEVFAKTGIYNRLKPAFRNGLLMSRGGFWKQQRRVVQPLFSSDHMAVMSVTINEVAAEFRDELLEKAAGAERIDLFEAMLDLSLRVITSTMFGIDFRRSHREFSNHVYVINRFLKRQIYDLVPIPTAVPIPRNRRFRRAMDFVDGVIAEIVKDRLARPDPGEDLIGLLLRARDPKTGDPMPLEQVRDEAFTMLLAGHETTATALSWAYLLADRHPACFETMHACIDAAFASGGGQVTGDMFADLAYLDDVFRESLRLRPPLWILYRHVTEGRNLGGVPLKRGDTVYVSAYLTHRDPRFWERPLEFDPGRFRDRSAIPKQAFFPFGAGPRTCIGANFAFLEARIIMAVLGRELSFDLSEAGEVEGEPLVTLKPVTPLVAKVRPR